MELRPSICPVCYKPIMGWVGCHDNVVLVKRCEDHGEFVAVVERDAWWYQLCQQLAYPKIYDGYMVDVTNMCNLNCTYCYHDNTGGHRPVVDILQEIEQHPRPIILTGGEPTLHPDLPEIISSIEGEVWVLTNGVNLEMFKRIIPLLTTDGLTRVGLSYHLEARAAFIDTLNVCLEQGIKLGTVFWVIDNLNQIPDAIACVLKYKKVIQSVRIKAASNLWHTDNSHNKIYTSDMVKYLIGMGAKLDFDYSQKVSYASLRLNDVRVHCVSWYDKYNVLLDDIDGPPWYRANDGSVNNLVTTCILNERCHATG